MDGNLKHVEFIGIVVLNSANTFFLKTFRKSFIEHHQNNSLSFSISKKYIFNGKYIG